MDLLNFSGKKNVQLYFMKHKSYLFSQYCTSAWLCLTPQDCPRLLLKLLHILLLNKTVRAAADCLEEWHADSLIALLRRLLDVPLCSGWYRRHFLDNYPLSVPACIPCSFRFKHTHTHIYFLNILVLLPFWLGNFSTMPFGVKPQAFCMWMTGTWPKMELIVLLFLGGFCFKQKEKQTPIHWIMSIHYPLMNGGFMSTISGI